MLKGEKKETKEFKIPPKIKCTYKNLKLLTETSSYKVYEAETHDSNEKHVIRILDHSKEFVNSEYGLTASLFVKELLHLQYRHPGSVITNTFEISEDGQQIACATLPYLPLSYPRDQSKEVFDHKDPQLIRKMISDALCDIEFLWKNFQLKKIMDVLGLESLCYMKEEGTIFLTDWARMFEQNTDNPLLSTALIQTTLQEEKLTSQELKEEIKALAMIAMKLNNIEFKEIEVLKQLKGADSEIYGLAVKAKLVEAFAPSIDLQGLLERMLSIDPLNLPELKILRLNEAGVKRSLKQELEKAEPTNKFSYMNQSPNSNYYLEEPKTNNNFGYQQQNPSETSSSYKSSYGMMQNPSDTSSYVSNYGMAQNPSDTSSYVSNYGIAQNTFGTSSPYVSNYGMAQNPSETSTYGSKK